MLGHADPQLPAPAAGDRGLRVGDPLVGAREGLPQAAAGTLHAPMHSLGATVFPVATVTRWRDLLGAGQCVDDR
jgi:hypothetical protein